MDQDHRDEVTHLYPIARTNAVSWAEGSPKNRALLFLDFVGQFIDRGYRFMTDKQLAMLRDIADDSTRNRYRSCRGAEERAKQGKAL